MPEKFDLNQDGVYDEMEVDLARKRILTQRFVAVASFVQAVGVTIGLIVLAMFGFLSAELIQSFSSFLGWYYTGSFGIVAAWYGAEAFLTRK